MSPIKRCLAAAVVFAITVTSYIMPSYSNEGTIYDSKLKVADNFNVSCRNNIPQDRDISRNWLSSLKSSSPNSKALTKLEEKIQNNETKGWLVLARRVWNGTSENHFDEVRIIVFNDDATVKLGRSFEGIHHYGVYFDNLEYLYEHTVPSYFSPGCDVNTFHSSTIYYENSAWQQAVSYSVEPYSQGYVTPTELRSSVDLFEFWSAPNGQIEYPSGYSGDIIPSRDSLSEQNYVALGDSFSSGEGNPVFEPGTNTAGVNECHRSRGAYPRLLQKSALKPITFVACSGATISNILNGQHNEASQLDSLNSDTETVTITIGGNDVGFTDYARSCYLTQCGAGTSAYNTIIENIDDSQFREDLRELYLEILINAPAADVYIVNYPYIVKDRSAEGCTVFPGGLSSNDAAAELVTGALNSALLDTYLGIKQDVQWAAHASRLHYINVNYPGSPFDGHDMCAGNGADSYFHGLDWMDTSNPKTLHPTQDGQQAYKEVIEDAIG